MKTGKVGVFRPAGKPYEVVWLGVESPMVHALNQTIKDNVPTVDTQPTYIPHITIAYVLPGLGQQWEGANDLAGIEWTAEELVWVNKGVQRAVIRLKSGEETNKVQDTSGHCHDEAGQFVSCNATGAQVIYGRGKDTKGNTVDEPSEASKKIVAHAIQELHSWGYGREIEFRVYDSTTSPIDFMLNRTDRGIIDVNVANMSKAEELFKDNQQEIAKGWTPAFAWTSLSEALLHEYAHYLEHQFSADQSARWESAFKDAEDQFARLKGPARVVYPSYYAQEDSIEAWAESVVGVVRQSDTFNKGPLASLASTILKELRGRQVKKIEDASGHCHDEGGQCTSCGVESFSGKGGLHIVREEQGRHKETTRLKSGKPKIKDVIDYRYVDSSTGKPISDEATLKRIRAMVIPPGVSNVRINPKSDDALLATWTDKKQRLVRYYSTTHQVESAASKFERIKDFSQKVPQIAARIRKDVDSPDEKTKNAARALYCIYVTAFRIGSERDTKADKKAYGVTTLKPRHAKVQGDSIKFSFIGKKGQRIRKTVNDPTLARVIRENTKSDPEQIFTATDADVRSYMKRASGDQFDPKDFRTWHGTAMAIDLMKGNPGPADDEKTFRRWQRDVATKVAEHLGNTPSVSLSSYIDWHVWDQWRDPAWGTWSPAKFKKEMDLWLVKEDGEVQGSNWLSRATALMDDFSDEIVYDRQVAWRKDPVDDPDE